MKKKKPAASERIALILALLGEGPKTSAELVERTDSTVKDVGNDLHRLKLVGKVKPAEERGGPWRLDGPAVSPLREEDDPAPPKPGPMLLSIADLVLDGLRGGPLSRGDLLEHVRPHLGGRDVGNLDAALGRLKQQGKIAKYEKLYRLGNGNKTPAEIRRNGQAMPEASALAGKPQVIRDLYELRDRIDLSIELLEGRIEIADVRRAR